MSRTYHHRGQHKVHSGQDLWSPGPTCGYTYSSYSKRLGRRFQRKRVKRELIKETFLPVGKQKELIDQDALPEEYIFW